MVGYFMLSMLSLAVITFVSVPIYREGSWKMKMIMEKSQDVTDINEIV